MHRIYVIHNFAIHNHLMSDVTGVFDGLPRVVDVADRAEDDGDGAKLSSVLHRCSAGRNTF